MNRVAILVLTSLCASAGTLTSAALADNAAPDIGRTAWLVGTWSCQSNTGSTGKLKYVRNTDGSLSMTNYFVTQVGGGEFNETYRFDSVKKQWTWTSKQPDGTIVREFGTAPAWTADTWTFDGNFNAIAPMGPRRSNPVTDGMVHMVYTIVNETTFTRTIETHGFGPGSGRSASLCTRTPPEAKPS